MNALKRRAELVGDIREDLSLGANGLRYTVGHVVERIRHLSELIGPIGVDARREVAGAEGVCRAHEVSERFYEVGSIAGLEETRALLASRC